MTPYIKNESYWSKVQDKIIQYGTIEGLDVEGSWLEFKFPVVFPKKCISFVVSHDSNLAGVSCGSKFDNESFYIHPHFHHTETKLSWIAIGE